MRSLVHILGVALTAIGSACATAPERPDVEVTLPASYGEGGDAGGIAKVDWSAFFVDERLTALITEALRHNPDREIALARVSLARAGVHRATGQLLPTVGAAPSTSLRRFGLFTMDGAGNATTDIRPGEPVPEHLPDFLLGLGASWELDVWGRMWSQRQSAAAQVLATAEGERLVQSSIVADVARAWFSLLAADHARLILDDTIARQESALEAVRAQKEAGRATELAVQQFEAELADTRVLAVEALQEQKRLESALNLLLGRLPQPIERAGPLPALTTTAIALGLPSDLLRQRPDVRAAEQLVVASDFDVRAAQAAFLPTIGLTGSAGVQAFNPIYLVDPQSIAYGLAGGLVAPLINRSAIEADFAASTALQREALFAYQKAILAAFVEVTDAARAVEAGDELLQQKTAQQALRRRSAEVADDLFRAGKATWIEVLLAQSATADAVLAVLDAWRARQHAVVTLYQALGGGWTAPNDDKPLPSPDDGLVEALLASGG